MSTLPDTDLSTALVTDASDAATIDEAENRLRHVTRLAGLRLPIGFPRQAPDGERLPLGRVDEPTARDLAALITTCGNTDDPAPDTPGITGAASLLRAAAKQAGIALHVGDPMADPDSHGQLRLGDIDQVTAAGLADLIEAQLADLVAAAADLQTALDAVGVTIHATAANGIIRLSEIDVAEGWTLLSHVAPDQVVPDEVDVDDYAAGDDLAHRLTAAVKIVSQGGFIDAAYAPFCRRCRQEAALVLGGRLTPDQAQRLTTHLLRDAA